MSALAEVDYNQLKTDFYACEQLTSKVRSYYEKDENIGFEFTNGGTRELISNLKVVSNIAKELQPIWLSCDNFHSEDASVPKEGIERINKLVDVFANPI